MNFKLEKKILSKHISLIALLLMRLIIGIVFTSYYTTFLKNDSVDQIAEKSVREQMEKTMGCISRLSG